MDHDDVEGMNEECPNGHGDVEVVEDGSYSGFAGGTCYWAKLSCGCNLVDEANDVEAAK